MRDVNAFTRIKELHPCKVLPLRRGMSWRYPWEVMAPGAMFAIWDTTPEARRTLSAAAAAAGKRLGMKFATGKMMDDRPGRELVHRGYWCCRVDGVEILPPPDTTLADKFKSDEWHERGKARLTRSLDKVKRPPTIQPVGSIEDVRARIDGEVGYVEAPEVTEARVAEWADAPGFDAGEDAL